MNPIITILWFLIFIKLLLFWLWIWQLKEYRLGRFLAHFEGQWFKKIISSFWRLKYPEFTKKVIIIFLTCLAAEILLLLYFSITLAIILTIFFIPLLILSFQIPTVIWRKIVIGKAKAERLKFKNLLVIGITGSYGKTSTKEFLNTILSSKFKVLSTPAHQNTDIAISKLILEKLTRDIEIFIVEMAAYKRGEITSPCQIVKPKIGILTGINEQHMATFGSQENIVKTKFELIEGLPRSESQVLLRGLPIDTIAFFNAKNKYCLELYNKTNIKKFLYGEAAKIFGEENLLGAMLVAKELGMSDEEITKAVEKIENRLPGIQQKGGVNGLIIIDATYSANPYGVTAHLEYLKTFPGRKIIVMSCLIELGKASKEVHRKIGKKIAEVCDLAIITTKDRFKEIKEGVVIVEVKPRHVRGLTSTKQPEIIFLENPKEIFEKIRDFCYEGDVVLLESRVPSEMIKLLTD